MGSTKDLFSAKSAPGPGQLIETPKAKFHIFLRTGAFFRQFFLCYLCSFFSAHLPSGASDYLPTLVLNSKKSNKNRFEEIRQMIIHFKRIVSEAKTLPE
jgi:hypothetical protein